MKVIVPMFGWRICSLVLAVSVLTGCGGPTPVAPAGTSADAVPVLTRALTAWKEGQTVVAMSSAEPPMIIRDEDWEAGTKLLDFMIVGTPVPYGGDWRGDALLTFDNQSEPVPVIYTVTVAPVQAIFRMDHPD